MHKLKALVSTALPLLLTAALHDPSIAGQMSGATMAPKSGQNAMLAGIRIRGQVVSFTKTTLTLKLADGKQKTFQVTPRQMGQLKLHKGQTVAVLAKGSRADRINALSPLERQ
jgi:RNase P/RNase MRP subunit p29